MTRDDALKILDELGNSPNMLKHALACGFVMRDLCEKISKGIQENHSEPLDPDDWEIVGLLHDADYEKTEKSLELHTEETTKKLQAIPADIRIIDAIRGHCDKAERKTMMAKAIYASDELTGLIVAAALVQPDKKLKSLNLESVMKKFKDKAFAKGANRDQIMTCESELKMPLEQFTAIVLNSMQSRSKELGL
jgi:predicted hydrolase (HD superfamily)